MLVTAQRGGAVIRSKESRAKADDGAYATFCRGVKVERASLTSLSAQMNWVARVRIGRSKKSPIRNLNQVYWTGRADEEYFGITGNFSLTIGDKKGAAVEIKCEFLGLLSAKIRNVRFSRRYGKSEARNILFPYFVRLVSEVSAKMNLEGDIVEGDIKELLEQEKSSEPPGARRRVAPMDISTSSERH